jgi:hypothetical protein
MTRRPTLLAAALLILAPALARADVTLVQDGHAKAVVYVQAAVMAADDKKAEQGKFPVREAEMQRRRLRESVNDLAHYLGKMSGTRVGIRTRKPGKDTEIPILVGALAVETFGPPAKKAPYKQGFRLVVTPKGVGLLGESDLAASYAIYELLDRLGCRWFMPSAMGEVVPERRTITLKEMDFSSAPGTVYRGIWYADDAFRRRNRHGGLLLSAGHALEFYLTKEDRKKHPEWRAEIGGKPHSSRLHWSSQAVADAIAGHILANHARNPQPSYSLSPDDGSNFDESKEDRALDAGDFDPTSQTVSLTDRLLVLANRIATRVNARAPEVKLGLLAYAQYIRPPVREKVHPAIVPQLAPIALCRFHSMTDDRVHGARELRRLVEGWGKAARSTSMYFYAYNLAETSAPVPMLAKWSADVPFVLRHNCKFWQPETLPNFDTHLHANYLGCRLAFDPSLKPADILHEINTLFYGHAAREMSAYWKYIDDVWTNTLDFSGCGFSYLRRWTPERLKEARTRMNAALAACRTPMEKRRVGLADDSLQLFERFMKLRRDLAEGRLAGLATEADAWRKQVVALGDKYKDQYAFTKVPWTPKTVSGLYFSLFYEPAYKDAARIAHDFQLLTPAPLRTFRYRADPERKGEGLGWSKAGLDDKDWKSTDVCLETWSTLGYHDYFKSMWYRTRLTVGAVPAGKKVFLWLGSTDGSAKVFVNGKHIPYVGSKKEKKYIFNGYCQPASFDVTAALKPGAKNDIAILCTRTFFNELGTGGLVAPMLLYRAK